MTREQEKQRSIERKQAREFSTAVTSYAYVIQEQREHEQDVRKVLSHYHKERR